jgi:hypothetical protein
MEKYGWTVVGTMNLTDKKLKERTPDDFPFPALSTAASKTVEPGWMRRATRQIQNYVVQGTIWKDNKIVAWLHTFKVCGNDTTARRYRRGQRDREEIKAPEVQEDYSKYFNAVDISDKDSAIYSTSIRSKRWYLRIFFWVLDRVIFSCYIVVCTVSTTSILRPKWSKYAARNNGQYNFQVDLGMQLMEKGVRLDWETPYNEASKPKWIRHTSYIPCECKQCFFCLEGKTTGTAHKHPNTEHKLPNAATKDTVVKCTCVKSNLPEDRVEIKKNNSRCQICHKHRSRKGCPCCNKVVCEHCWPAFDHFKH